MEPLDQFVDPPASDAMLAGQLGWAAALQDHCVNDVTTECGHAPPPSLVARTMSCDIRELCGELRHFRPCHLVFGLAGPAGEPVESLVASAAHCVRYAPRRRRFPNRGPCPEGSADE